ncbi:protein NPGR2 isoform X1 [Solanum pennellii]|uniref:Protein NPGR2 isoform X1 n=1 Tax=Solanum pennellii TaxID=28526 RepID=A0ABM1HPY3_SOLPN|nr:protein NPGR2 isoform X1 [Solanum pennellii]XP_015088668.1 protein NPGR2 isoform X1 [Solanum pennellii]XP_015088669.1 protein NPGR2 isoform X1 [Solanum pennellii]
MNCLSLSEHILMDEMVTSPESLATKDHTSSVHSLRAGEAGQKPDTGNIEEAESSLRESGCLNYEEARALLGRYEYQKGNIEAALHVFEGIDIASVTPKLKLALAERVQTKKRRSRSFSTPPLSINAVSLLLEAVFLKAKSLQALQRYKEAAQSCTVVLDILESSLPAGLPETFATDCKLQDTLNKAVELLPELCKLADAPREAIMSYRRALLHQWNLDIQTTAKIQKEFAIFLLYSGGESCPPNLQSQMDGSFVPRNNIEEAILLLMILLRKISLQRIEWDPSILDHLSYALSISGGLKTLASKVEELLPRTIDQQEKYLILALCYYGGGDDFTALNLLRELLRSTEDHICVPGLLLASKVCAESPDCASEGIIYAHRAIERLQERCSHLLGVANCVLGLSLTAHSRTVLTDSERVKIHSDALKSFESAGKLTKMSDTNVIYHLCLENAEQRKLDVAVHYANWFLKLEGGSTLKGSMLLARVLSAQKRFLDAETIINVALEQSGKWDHGELLRTKAKLQIAQGQVKNAIEIYTQILAILQVQRRSFGLGEDLEQESGDHCRTLELETWLDLASIYIKLSQWRDAEKCLSKTETISSYSACRLYTAGLLNQSKGLYKAALGDYSNALAVNPYHVPSLVSSAVVLMKIGKQSPAIIRSLLTEALRLDRMNASAWYNLGLLYKEGGLGSAAEAADCFEAAIILEETEPVEPFR